MLHRVQVVAATMLRRPEPTNERVEPKTFRAAAIIEFCPFDQVHPAVAATNSTLYVAHHHAAYISPSGSGGPN